MGHKIVLCATANRELLGPHYGRDDEIPTDGSHDDADWRVLLDDNEHRVLTGQENKDTTPPMWPSELVAIDSRPPTAGHRAGL